MLAREVLEPINHEHDFISKVVARARLGETCKRCPNPRLRDRSGCICDLREWARKFSDWPIARLVGAATYAQLLDSAPGLYEPFPDFRSDGNTASSISEVTATDRALELGSYRAPLDIELYSPPPPNTVSGIMADGVVSPADLKRMLIRAAVYGEITGTIYPKSQQPSAKKKVFSSSKACSHASCDCQEDESSPDALVAPLIGSSISYQLPESSLFDIVSVFIGIAALVGIVIGVALTLR